MESKCKNCIYSKNCQFIYVHRDVDVMGCSAFDDKRNYVRVVRCGNCIHKHDRDCPIAWDLRDDDYCSFGEEN